MDWMDYVKHRKSVSFLFASQVNRKPLHNKNKKAYAIQNVALASSYNLECFDSI